MRRLAFSLPVLALIGVLIGVLPAFAQEAPPARVGRVSFVAGQLGFHLAGETAWSAAKVNYPVATGGSFWTDPKSRAELRIGSRTISFAGDTVLDVTKLDQQVMQLAVPQGRINLRVRTLLEGESIEIDLPRGAVWILQPGIYDIDSGGPDQPERIAVFEGSARFVGGTLDVAVNAGDAAIISGTQTLTAATERATTDDFTKWCRSRDYDERRLAAPYHVSPQMTGYEELDEYGSWRAVPQYGEVWFPRRVASGWAPYREGHWVWVEPWGWSWVDDEPWGFAPFHYGRWAMVEDQWAWVPGEFVPMPVYAPALVAFVGEPGVGYWDAPSVGPAVGWFPLAPGEVYWPSYTRNVNYIRNVNITNVNVTTINQITSAGGSRGSADPPPQVASQTFANRNAATIVPARVFANAAPVAPAARQIPQQIVQQAVKQAPVSVRPPQLTPVIAKGPGNAAGPRGSATAGTLSAPGTAAAPPIPGKGHAPGGAMPGTAQAPVGPGPMGAPGGPGKGHEPTAPSLANAPIEPGKGREHGAPGPATAPGAAHAPPVATAPEHKPGPGLAHAPAVAAPTHEPPAHQPSAPGRFEASREPPPNAVHGPMRMGPQPQAAHTPPPAPKAPPPAIHEPPHAAAPPQIMRAGPPPMREPPHMPAPQAVHAAPPPMPHPAPPPPQIVHAAPPPAPHMPPPAPPAQVFRGAPPAPPAAPHPPPAPPQIAHAPAPAPAPAAVARPATPPPAPKGAPPAKGGPPGKEEKH
jgi:hypothetical protein